MLRAAPIRSCSRWGLPCRLPLPETRCALTAPFQFRGAETFATCFLLHCPLDHSSRPLAGTVISWSPDFPRRGSYPPRRGRPTLWQRRLYTSHGDPSSCLFDRLERFPSDRHRSLVKKSRQTKRLKRRSDPIRSKNALACLGMRHRRISAPASEIALPRFLKQPLIRRPGAGAAAAPAGSPGTRRR